jgi:c-di-GMP-binding flagellar brake protein YcgR
MDTAGTRPQNETRLELPGNLDLDRFMLYSAAEIRQLLRDIGENTELVTISFDTSHDFVLTSVVGVTETAVIIDAGTREDLNRRLLASSRLLCVTSRDRIKVQWKAERAEKVMYNGRLAFRMALPNSVLRLQRREYYRLAAPVAKPLACLLQPGATGAPKKLEFTVADISVGGLAMHGPSQQAGLEIGKRYEGCEIPLPELGMLVTTLAVANIFEVTLKNGNTTLRSGCQFVGMQGKTLAMLQKYINRIERERHERMARFA